jgi:hypothetical protein
MLTRRQLLETPLAGVAISLMGTGTASAQGTPANSTYVAYWELLRSTVPADADGATALVEIAAAGGMSVIEQSQVTAALAFVEEWSGTAEEIDLADVPEYARLFHKEFVGLLESVTGRLEYTELKDITESVQYWGLGLLAMLVGATNEAS